jgi:hypothetical protein
MCSEKYFKSVTDQGFTIALRLVWRLLDACFAFSSCRPPQTVHSLGMALAKTPQPNKSQPAWGNLP